MKSPPPPQAKCKYDNDKIHNGLRVCEYTNDVGNFVCFIVF
jgi:hypothetical protein